MQYFKITLPYIEAKTLKILSDTLANTEKIQSVNLKFNIQNLKKFIAFNMFSSYACHIIKSL
jgi:hypothetical protein